MKNRLETQQSGFTLIELLVVIVILGIVSALAYPAYASMVRRARYAEVKQQMGAMAKEVQIYLVEKGTYPADMNVGQKPDWMINWPTETPLNGTYDYDHWGVGGGKCYVQIGFRGEDGQTDYRIHQTNADPQNFKEFEDDLVLGIDLYDCPISQGAIR